MFSRIAQSGLFMLLISLSVLAQTQTTPPSAKTSIIIDRQLVRFITAGEALEWRLLVTNQQGELAFDSGLVYGSALEWPLLNQQGQGIESGLYTYTVTTKAATDETPRTQRGHLIVDRASSNDRVWLTSSPETALGGGSDTTKLTIVGSGETTLGGAEFPGGAPRRETSAERPESLQRLDTETAMKKPNTPAVVNGTNNRIAKFAPDGEGLLDTQLSESNGALVVGNAGAVGNIQIFGQANQDVFAGMGPDVVNGPAFNYGYAGSSFGRSAGFFNVRPDASAVAPNPSLRFLTANQQRMIITNTGNVGIGTPNPSALLEIQSVSGVANGEANLHLNALGNGTPLIRLKKDGVIKWGWLGEFPAAGKSALYSYDLNQSVLTLVNNGRVGIGTDTPQAKLEVRGDVKLGSSGQYFATSGEENLRIVRGVVRGDGFIEEGANFSVTHVSEGTYDIIFNTPFSDLPTITATAARTVEDLPEVFVRLNTVSTTTVRLHTVARSNGSYEDARFHFIAIGPR